MFLFFEVRSVVLVMAVDLSLSIDVYEVMSPFMALILLLLFYCWI